MITRLTFLKSCILMVSIFACGNAQTENEINKSETPSALKGSRIESGSYGSRQNDLIEELYDDLMEESEDLKNLDDGITDQFRNKSELSSNFSNYDGKSESYYSSANYKVSMITDTILRQRIEALLKQSEKQYQNLTFESRNNLKVLTQNETAIRQYYSAMKIAMTIPVLEKFQANNLPDVAKYKSLIKRQQETIAVIDNKIGN